jgi:polyhydroxybutyrate depolymerase
MVALLLTLALQAPQPHTVSWKIDGVERTAVVVAPSVRSAHPPVLFGFHGHGGNGRQFARSAGIVGSWPEAVMVFPNGLPTPGMTDPAGKKPGWQQKAGDQGDRDLKFFDAMLAWADKTYHADPKHRYAMGHSNGGRFTYLLWAQRGDKFAAYGPSGSPGWTLVPQLRPASAFFIAGESDPLIPFASQKRTIDALARKFGVGEWKGTGLVKRATGRDGVVFGTYLHPGGHEYPKAGAKATLELFRADARGSTASAAAEGAQVRRPAPTRWLVPEPDWLPR